MSSLAYFEYNGTSSKYVIGSPLMLCTYDSVGDLGSTRNETAGESTLLRPIANEYGTVYEPLSFSSAIIKDNSANPAVTDAEQRAIERWLTSPKTSRKLTVIDCEGNGEEYCYFGKFLTTNWIMTAEGLSVLTFTFKATTAYPLKYVYEKIWNGHENYAVTGSAETHGYTAVNCISDELEEYVFPDVYVIPYSGGNSNFSITSGNDFSSRLRFEEDTIKVFTNLNTALYFDCKNCIAYEATLAQSTSLVAELIRSNANHYYNQLTDPAQDWTSDELKFNHINDVWNNNGTYSKYKLIEGQYMWTALTIYPKYRKTHEISYKKLGWSNLDYIWWPRLIPGSNSWTIRCDAMIYIGYYAPYKKVGGWLV